MVFLCPQTEEFSLPVLLSAQATSRGKAAAACGSSSGAGAVGAGLTRSETKMS